MSRPVRSIVFARAPLAGRVKTRLIPALGRHGACLLHERMVTRTLATCRAAATGPLELCVDAPHPFFTACAERHDLDLTLQAPGELGRRMSRALARALQHGPALLLGTDCPQLTADDLRAAAAALADADVVLAPAQDGGYVLIGLARHHPALFEDIAWGGDRVLAQTRARIARLRWRARLLREVWDLDRPDDLERLRRYAPAMMDSLTAADHAPAQA